MSTVPPASTPNVSLPITTSVTLPTAASEERMPIRRAEWQRLRAEAADMVNPVANASQWATFFAGVSFAAVLAAIPWQASYSTLTGASENKGAWAWVTPALVIASIASAVLAGFCLWVHKKVTGSLKSGVTRFCEEMDAIEAMHPAGP